MKKNVFITIFLLITFFVRPQSCDTTAIAVLYNSSHKNLSKDVKKALAQAHEAVNLSKACSGTNSYYESLFSLCRAYYQLDMPDSTVILLKPLVENIPANIPLRHRANLYHSLSSAYVMKMKLEDGLKFCLLALKDYEQLNDTINTSNSLVNIANVYQQQNNFKQANSYLRKAESLASKLRNKIALGNVYNTMGILYAEHSQLDSAETFFLKSTTIREKLGDNTSVVWNYNNLGGVYLLKKQPEKAVVYLEKALKSFESLGNVDGQSSVATNLGELYMQLNNRKKALSYYLYSRRLYAVTKDDDNLENLYTNLSNYYDYEGDLKTAFKYSDSLIVLKDTLYGRRLDRSIAEMQTKYEVEKKDLEIAKSEAELKAKVKESEIKNIIIVSVILFMLLLIIIIVIFYRQKQLKQKAKVDAELAHQKDIRAKAIIEAEEKERVRIAKDLHDGVGQLLSAAKMNLSSIQDKIKITSDEDNVIFKNALELVDESVKEVRTVSHKMMPNTLLKMGLASAVKEFITKIQNTPNLKVNLEIVGLTNRLEQEKESVLYRVIQELVSNIIKHAKATELTLQLIKHDTELTIMIEDNGLGFDTSKISTFEGIGLKNIMSRVEFINGTVHFDSEPGKGTRVILDIPA